MNELHRRKQRGIDPEGVNWEYDKSPAPGREKNDYTYIISLGYLWAN
jgi:hypothetical protein